MANIDIKFIAKKKRVFDRYSFPCYQPFQTSQREAAEKSGRYHQKVQL